jgi:Protease inhibitor Inh
MTRLALICLGVLGLMSSAVAQAPAQLGDSAKALIGTWEFSNADRDKTCAATFKSDATKVGFKVEFDANCVNLFPLVANVAGWTFPDDDLLRLLDAQGRVLVEFSEVEDGIYEAPTPGLGVLFLQNAAAAGPPPKQPDVVAGTWAVTRRNGAAICTLSLSANPAKDGFGVTVMPGCDASIARLNLTQWQLDRDQLLLVPARGNPWRFEEIEGGNWRRVPDTADSVTLVRQ